MNPTHDVIIIGAGAAGLMCAIESGKRGRKTLILDSANKVGKKILMSGGGRCNFTNENTEPSNFISQNPHFCKSALSRYTQWDFIEMVNSHNIPFHEKTLGQLFCDNKSKDILQMLLSEVDQAKAQIRLNCDIQQVKKEGDLYVLRTSKGKFSSQSLIVATGGLSIPTLGSSPFAFHLAEQFDLKVNPIRAALVPFTLHQHDKEKYSELSGVSVNAIVSNERISFRENILFTHRGLSGPAILQISSYWNPGEAITINILPETDLFETFKQQKGQQQLKNALQQYFPKRLLDIWLSESDANTRIADFNHEKLQNICQSFNAWRIKPNGTEGYRTAEVTLGGIDCDALSSKTMEVKAHRGLYFVGEALDVTGWLGGFNFQWAWSSGWAAGQVC